MSARILNIGRDLQSRLRGFFDTPPGPDAAPLELLQRALDELERKVQPAGRGRRIFPYTSVTIQIAQTGADAAAVDAVFKDFDVRLRDRLAELNCEMPERIRATVTLVDAGDEGPALSIHCAAEPQERPAPLPPGRRPLLTIAVVKGECAEREYVFDEPSVAIGRTAEPTDAYGQVRFNHVAFADVRDGITETVGRAHAVVKFDEASGQYHVFNEGSSNPTSIVRAGRTIKVPRDPRGVRLMSGDQLQLGRAVLRISVGEASPGPMDGQTT